MRQYMTKIVLEKKLLICQNEDNYNRVELANFCIASYILIK